MGPNPSALTGAAALDGARMGRTLGTVSLMLCSRSRLALRCHVRQGATMAALPQDYKKASTQGEEKRCVYPHAAVLDCPIGPSPVCPKVGAASAAPSVASRVEYPARCPRSS